MINTKALGELLSHNRDGKLCKQWCLMTLNGTLLAYSQPTDAKVIRKLAAVAALSWQEYEAALPTSSTTLNRLGDLTKPKRRLYALTIESDSSNVLVRRLQPELLLVLEGGVPPRRRTFEPHTTAEDFKGEPLTITPDQTSVDTPLGTSISSKAESSVGASASVLGLHRRKLDAMASAITADFERTGFKMPDESVNKFF